MTLDDLKRARSVTVRTGDGHDLGDIEAVWYEAPTGLLRWLRVRRGLLGVSHAVIPARGLVLSPERIEAPWPLETVEEAPDGDATDHESMLALASHYGVGEETAATWPLLFADVEPVDEEAETQRW